MNSMKKRSLSILVGAAWAGLSGLPAVADDTELFVTDSAKSNNSPPNILFILDTSGSMDTFLETQPTYDPSVVYPGACDTNRMYWRTGYNSLGGDDNAPPHCTTNDWFNASAFTCAAAMTAIKNGTGYYTDRFAQFDDSDSDNARWLALSTSQKSRYVECEDDAGRHGETAGDSDIYPQNGNGSDPWTSDSWNSIGWGQWPTNVTYNVYEGNFVNWYYGPLALAKRLGVMQDVTTNLLDQVSGVNVGLMRFHRADGGPVIHHMEDVATARAPMQAKIAELPSDGRTPLAESLYEAGLYYMGRTIDFGDDNDPAPMDPNARSSTSPSAYDSPINLECQKNFVVLLTDGEPNRDYAADSKITGLPGYSTATGNASCTGSGDGHCLDDMAAYLYESDLSPLPGKQNVVTYTIGFTIDLPLLDETAQRGGGGYFQANDTATLTTALTDIVQNILDTQTTFAAPATSVNAFNRTRHLNDLFITAFQPTGKTHWPGNLKKFRLRASDGEIIDANGNLAVDPATGFFSDGAQSFWSSSVDGPSVTDGGAVEQLPAPATRNVYTYLAGSLLTSAGNQVNLANANIDDQILGIGAPGDPTRDQLVEFMRGVDTADHDGDNDVAEPRTQMGDPLHGAPISVIYGGTTVNPDLDDAVVYFGTNDGYLHAVDPNTGIEKWSFIPPDFLDDQLFLFQNGPSSQKHYGIDGNLRVSMNADNNGVVEAAAGETVHLYFGMRRGGDFYYGLDVTNPDSPQVLWRLDRNTLPGIGQSWSTPVPTKINIPGAPQNPDNSVLIFSGGYDTSQDLAATGTDAVGNALYIVDAVSGQLLWHASDANAALNVANMQYSIPSDVKVLDLNSDTFADRMYVGDMGGQVWRFDIHNGQPANSLVTGGVIAQLGGAPIGSPSAAESRRFYYAPDLALIGDEYSSFLHIGIGSGHRAHPNSLTTQDRFYALRDYEPFQTFTQAQYDARTPITDADLLDITDDVNAAVPPGSPGWRFELRDPGWIGEKVLAEARTFNNQVFFTTFTPNSGVASGGCSPALGTNRVYIMDLVTGAPVNNLDNSSDPDNLTETDRYREIQGSIASEVTFLFPSPDDPVNCVGDECTPPPVACVGLFCFPPGFGNDPIRTFWSQESTQ